MTSCRCGMPSFGYRACYHCLKEQHLDGGGLSEDELVFAWSAPTPPRSAGWRYPDELPTLAAFADEDGQPWLSDAETRLLRILADVPADV
ncbi:MAG: hypothetical protein ACR2L4_00655 [Actinomycetota bacterium]